MLSIIIPAREEEKIIERTIRQFESLRIPHETIVSDDASSDRTAEIARRFADAVVTYNGNKHVVSRARNAGAKAARGDIFVFIDSDSYFPDPTDFFERARAQLESDSSLLALATAQWVRSDMERPVDRLVFGLDNLINRFLNNVLHHGAGAGKCMIVRKSAFERTGGFNENLVFREDGDFFRRISKIGKVRFDPNLAVYHSGRRLHRLGVVRFYSSWIINGLYTVFLERARDKEWKPIR
ncbi:glycosyltransferase [Candidatus Kaiserbacteria bacterium]|nr:glycosyltransferase [Candidatus Kaiserbacteria bacterium]